MNALTTVVFAGVFLSASASGQQMPNGPVKAKRLPPEKPPGLATILDYYDFGAQIAALGSDAQSGQGVPPETHSPVPEGFKPRTDVPLTETAREAVQLSAKWMSENNQPSVGREGRVLYVYGAGLPTVVCAPLRVCIIELQSGEKLVGEPQIGDSVRWNLSPALYGDGESSTSVIVLKPQSPGLDTNLLVTTNRRAYYLRLVSKPNDYVARVAFAYPEDENQRQWHDHLAQQKERELKRSRIAELALGPTDSLFFNYRIKGGDASMRPVRVFDDGKKTYIQMGPETKHREAPVLVVLGADGKQEMVNYRVKDDMYIVDRLFERAQLILGSGKKARKVEISRERKG